MIKHDKRDDMSYVKYMKNKDHIIPELTFKPDTGSSMYFVQYKIDLELLKDMIEQGK